MKPRTVVELKADFPDDQIDGDDDVIQFGGRNIAEALMAALRSAGYEVSEPVYADEHGWELYLTRDRQELWLQVTSLGHPECVVMAANRKFFVWPSKDALPRLLTDLQSILDGDPRFTEMAWSRPTERRGAKPASGPFEP